MTTQRLLLATVAFTFLVCLSSSVLGQQAFFHDLPYKERNSGSFSKGSSIISVGYGFVSADPFNNLSSIYNKLGTFYGKYEYGITDEIGIGTSVSYLRFKYSEETMFGKYSEQLTVMNYGLLGYYHFNKLINAKNTDVYIGAGFSLRTMGASASTFGFSDKIGASNQLKPNVKLGIRQYLGGNLGIYAEVGYDAVSIVNTGISLRLGKDISKKARKKLEEEQKKQEEQEDIETEE